jgi:hypothetical protein
LGVVSFFLLIRDVVFARHARRGWPDLSRTGQAGLLPSEQGRKFELKKSDVFQGVRKFNSAALASVHGAGLRRLADFRACPPTHTNSIGGT